MLCFVPHHVKGELETFCVSRFLFGSSTTTSGRISCATQGMVGDMESRWAILRASTAEVQQKSEKLCYLSWQQSKNLPMDLDSQGSCQNDDGYPLDLFGIGFCHQDAGRAAVVVVTEAKTLDLRRV